jgi:hypothetical protein
MGWAAGTAKSRRPQGKGLKLGKIVELAEEGVHLFNLHAARGLLGLCFAFLLQIEITINLGDNPAWFCQRPYPSRFQSCSWCKIPRLTRPQPRSVNT